MSAQKRLTPAQQEELLRRRAGGESYESIGKDLGLTLSTVRRYCMGAHAVPATTAVLEELPIERTLALRRNVLAMMEEKVEEARRYGSPRECGAVAQVALQVCEAMDRAEAAKGPSEAAEERAQAANRVRNKLEQIRARLGQKTG